MDYEFSSLKELFDRVRPALKAKISELERKGYSNIQEMDIWNELSNTKWKCGKDLMLSDIIHDIMSYEIIDQEHSKMESDESKR